MSKSDDPALAIELPVKKSDELREFDPLDIDEFELASILANRAESWPTSMAGDETLSASRHSIVGKGA